MSPTCINLIAGRGDINSPVATIQWTVMRQHESTEAAEIEDRTTTRLFYLLRRERFEGPCLEEPFLLGLRTRFEGEELRLHRAQDRNGFELDRRDLMLDQLLGDDPYLHLYQRLPGHQPNSIGRCFEIGQSHVLVEAEYRVMFVFMNSAHFLEH